MEKYDLCVIGGGPSGYAAAMRAVDFGKTVLLVERDRLGGAGIYDGALSSKTFWEISKEFASFSKKMRHYCLSEPNVNFHNVLQEVNDAVFERSDQLNQHLRKIIQQRPELECTLFVVVLPRQGMVFIVKPQEQHPQTSAATSQQLTRQIITG